MATIILRFWKLHQHHRQAVCRVLAGPDAGLRCLCPSSHPRLKNRSHIWSNKGLHYPHCTDQETEVYQKWRIFVRDQPAHGWQLGLSGPALLITTLAPTKRWTCPIGQFIRVEEGTLLNTDTKPYSQGSTSSHFSPPYS